MDAGTQYGTRVTLRLHEQFCKTCSEGTTWCVIAQGIVKHEADKLLKEENRELRAENRRIRAVKDESVEQKEQLLRSVAAQSREINTLNAQLQNAAKKGK